MAKTTVRVFGADLRSRRTLKLRGPLVILVFRSAPELSVMLTTVIFAPSNGPHSTSSVSAISRKRPKGDGGGHGGEEPSRRMPSTRTLSPCRVMVASLLMNCPGGGTTIFVTVHRSSSGKVEL